MYILLVSFVLLSVLCYRIYNGYRRTTTTVAPQLGSKPLRIITIGISSAGKSTLAKKLALEHNLDYIELDHLNWKPNWTESSREEFSSKVTNALDESEKRITEGLVNGWITDGNYRAIREILWSRASFAIWLDYSFSVVFIRGLIRALTRIIYKLEVCNGNIETWSATFASRDSILLWIISMHKPLQRELPKQLSEHPNIKLIRLSSPLETEQWVAKQQCSN